MQAIITKYRGPTDSTGSRFVASCDAGRIVVPYDHAHDFQSNHELAAKALRDKLDKVSGGAWSMGRWVAGALPNGDYAHVCFVGLE